MQVGEDLFKWMAFIIQLIRIFIEIFGDDDERKVVKNNHVNV